MGVPLPVPLAVYVASKVAAALDYAHRRRDADGRELNIVHRDVSPQNILISYEGDIKLCDFGIAKAASKASQTQSGALKGKIQYMSPEQAWGKPIDRRSDLFSLGVVLFEMLTGERLFRGDTDINVLEKVRAAEVAPPSRVEPRGAAEPRRGRAQGARAGARRPLRERLRPAARSRLGPLLLHAGARAARTSRSTSTGSRRRRRAVADAKAREAAQAAHEAEPAARKRKSKGAPVAAQDRRRRRARAEPAAAAPPAPPPPPRPRRRRRASRRGRRPRSSARSRSRREAEKASRTPLFVGDRRGGRWRSSGSSPGSS